MIRFARSALLLALTVAPAASFGQATQPPAQHRVPSQPATAPTACYLAGQAYSVGATMCLSAGMWQVCQAPDEKHVGGWWAQGAQPLCANPVNIPR